MFKGLHSVTGNSSTDKPNTSIVRPTKKPTNFGPISGVPKSGEWRGVWKKCFTQMVEKVGVGNITGSLFWLFHVLSWFMGGSKVEDFVPKNFNSATSKCGLENQLPSLVDLFDRCFFHTTGEGLQLWFLKSNRHFLTVRTLTFCYVWGYL